MYRFTKRFFDILFSLFGIALLLPLVLPIMLLLRLTAEGEVFYFQRRIGRYNRPFYIWKFATMLKNSPDIGAGTITLRNDPRVTTVGRILRMTKFNELPQIVNVLRGDMSFVGPRPLDDRGFMAYPEDLRSQVYQVAPGITGIGSIVFRDEEKLISAAEGDPREFYKAYIAPYKGTLEMWYQLRQSFLIDLILLFLTVWVILFPFSRLVYRVFKDLPERPAYLLEPAQKP